MPGEPEVPGLLALMLLHDARREGRTDGDGELVLLADQDRCAVGPRADRRGLGDLARRGRRARGRPPGPYALQAAIAAEHATRATAADTDWARIRHLYDWLAAVDALAGRRAQPGGRGRDGRGPGARARRDRRDRGARRLPAPALGPRRPAGARGPPARGAGGVSPARSSWRPARSSARSSSAGSPPWKRPDSAIARYCAGDVARRTWRSCATAPPRPTCRGDYDRGLGGLGPRSPGLVSPHSVDGVEAGVVRGRDEIRSYTQRFPRDLRRGPHRAPGSGGGPGGARALPRTSHTCRGAGTGSKPSLYERLTLIAIRKGSSRHS